MAFLEQRGDWYRIVFTWKGRRYSHTIHTTDPEVAEESRAQIDKTIGQIQQGLLVLPEEASVKEFIVKGGSALAAEETGAQAKQLTLAELQEQYLAAQKVAVEDYTLKIFAMQLRHFEHKWGANYPIGQLSLGKLQSYVIERMADKGQRGRPLSSSTIRNELATLRSAWNWALAAKLVGHPFPNKGLKVPKLTDQPPFQTWAEIERQIARGGLSEVECFDLWECVFLSSAEIEELLAFVKTVAKRPWIYPMFCFAAHTGARVSEMLRAQIGDLDWEGQNVRIREKKRSRGRFTSRRVPLSAFLTGAMRDWLAVHPGGPYLFAKDFRYRSHTRLPAPVAPVKAQEPRFQFRQTLRKSKWQVLPGWHMLRHSFCSCCAAKGIDQRLINSWVGHQTEIMVLRYRHVFPSVEQKALQSVFG